MDTIGKCGHDPLTVDIYDLVLCSRFTNCWNNFGDCEHYGYCFSDWSEFSDCGNDLVTRVKI